MISPSRLISRISIRLMLFNLLLVFLPVANKLKELSAEEANYRNMLLDAVLAIQAGENPRMLGERLETFLPPSARGAAADDKAKGAGVAEEAEPAEEKEAA